MSKIWKGVAILCVVLLVLGVALVAVAYFTGGSVQRLMATTDITDMTKFVSRDVLQYYVNSVFDFFGRLFG